MNNFVKDCNLGILILHLSLGQLVIRSVSMTIDDLFHKSKGQFEVHISKTSNTIYCA